MFSSGLILLPNFTVFPLSTVSAISEVTSTNKPKVHHNDPGALVWKEMTRSLFTSENPGALWNPYSGAGFPIFLDGHFRETSISRKLLSVFPTENMSDFIVFVRQFIWCLAFILVFRELSMGIRAQAIGGFFSLMLPYFITTLDHVFLDVDMTAPWILLWLLLFQNPERHKKAILLSLGLGLWNGMQAFVQSQITFSLAFALAHIIGLFLLVSSGGDSKRYFKNWMISGMAYLLPFLFLVWPLYYQIFQFLPELVTSRPPGSCYAGSSVGLTQAFADSLVGFLKNVESNILFTVPGLLLLAPSFGSHRIRGFLLAYFLFLSFPLLGAGSLFCGVPGINGVSFQRHFLAYVQSSFFCLCFFSAYVLYGKWEKKKWLWFAVGLIVFGPFLRRTVLNVKAIQGSLYAEKFDYHRQEKSEFILKLQKLTREEDRRFISMSSSMFPNWSSVFGVMDLRLLEAFFPERWYFLNSQLYSRWESNSINSQMPDRFTGSSEPNPLKDLAFQRVLAANRISVIHVRQDSQLADSGVYSKASCNEEGRLADGFLYKCGSIGTIGYFPEKVEVLENKKDVVARLISMDPALILTTAILEQREATAAQPAAGKVLSVERTANRLAYKLDVSSSGVFIVADNWFPGWTAAINNRPVPIFHANVAWKAVAVEEGIQYLELCYASNLSPTHKLNCQ